jgi:DNA topoisomerase-3
MLIITEKPDVARQFSGALRAELKSPYTYINTGKNILITHCRGHLLEMARAEQYDIRMRKWNYQSLPVVPSEFRYNIRKEKGVKDILKTVSTLIKEAIRNKDEIMIATDAGREGEVIARLVLGYAKAEAYDKLSRFWVSESTAEPKVVFEGIEKRKPLKAYDRLAELGITWKKCDWIFGINMTVLFSLMGRETMNTGRVQTAVLREIYERQKKVEGFVPKEYNELEIITEDGIAAVLIKPNGDQMFDVDSIFIKQAEEAVFKNKNIIIRKITEKKEATEPPLLYSSSDLIKEAYRLYGFSPDKTVSIMQKLYEEKGVLSYPRTPSRVLGEGNEALAGAWIKEQLSHEKEWEGTIDLKKYTVANKRLFNNEKLEDHYGLVPLKYMAPDAGDGYKIWKLVQRRFLMQGMDKYIVEKNEVIMETGGYLFLGKYSHTIQKGWKAAEIMRRDKADEEEVKEIFKVLRQGMLQKVVECKAKKKKTKPPLLYNYGTIIGFMQNPKNESEDRKLVGIGTEATRPATLKGLETHGLMKDVKGLVATEKGKKLLKLLEQDKLLRKTIRPEETTAWEEMGAASPGKLLESTIFLVKEVVKNMEGQMAIHERESFGKCPACGGDIYEGENSYYCSNYKDKECKVHLNKLIMGNTFDKEKAREFFKTLETPVMKGMTKDGNEVEFQMVYDEAKKDTAPVYKGNQVPLGKCPVCGRDIFVGSKSYFCSGYKDDANKCGFILWKETEGAQFSPDMIKRLLNNETLSNVPCFTKTGEEYAAGFRLNKSGELVKIEYGGGRKDGGGKEAQV